MTTRPCRTVSNGDLVVLEAGTGRVTVLWDADKDGVSDQAERAELVHSSNLNHGLLVDEERGFLYATTYVQHLARPSVSS